ncbi:MAG: sensor domain-containing diguanylate cyclase [Achromobacter sp.]|nr:sensor domain-containing diguanylate cyclase [Achromobacter sp.]
MPVIGDPYPTRPSGDGLGGAHSESDGRLDRLARLARRLFQVDMAVLDCAVAAGALQGVDGTPPAHSPSWSIECPVRAADGRLLGGLRLLHGQPREFTDGDRQDLADLADLAAAAIAQHHAQSSRRADEDSWREEARKLALAIEGSGTGVWDRNVVTGEIIYSPGWKALLGYSDSELTTRIEDAYTRLHPDDLDFVQAAMQDHFDGKTESYEVEHRVRCKDGSYKWICSRGKVISRDESGKALRMMGTTTDISTVRAMAERLRLTADLVVNLTDAVPGLVFQCQSAAEGGSRFSYVSAGIWDMFELTADDVRASTTAIERRIHPEDLPAYRASQQQAAAALTRWHLEFRVCLPLQGVRWRQGDASPSRDPDNGVVWHGFVTDITDRKRAELELRELAATDALTNLPNRRHFMSRIAAELTRLQRHGGQGSAVLMCDLDHFKRINDTWGHAIGDGVLQHFASMLRAQLREIDLVGRIGGEEFAVVLPDTSIESAHLFARDVQHRIADTPYLSDGLQVPLTVSIGISALHAKDDHAELALSRSDRALYYAKQRGRNRIESVFSR